MEIGDTLYQEIKNGKSKNYVEPREFPKDYRFRHEDVSFKCISWKVYSGLLSTRETIAEDGVYCLDDLVTYDMQDNSFIVGSILTVNSLSIGLIASKDLTYIFDSHARNQNGDVDCDGTAVVLKFANPICLVEYINNFHGYPVNDYQFDFITVRIDKLYKHGQEVVLSEYELSREQSKSPSKYT